MKRAAILAILALIPALAQAQWTARLAYPPSLSLKLEHLWSLTITNQATGPTEVMLHTEVNEQTRGLQFKGTTNKISIPPGGKRITRKDVTNLEDTYYEPGIEKKLKKTQMFPAGRYTFCLQVTLAELPLREVFAVSPNPMSTEAQVDYSLGMPGKVSLVIYNVLGRLVRVLEDGMKPAGIHRVSWDGKDANGRLACSGVYFMKLKTPERSKTARLVVVR